MEKKVPFAPVVVLIDALYIDRLCGELASHFAPVVGRPLRVADLAVFLECLSLDAGVRPGNNEIQVIFIYGEGEGRMRFWNPAGLDDEVSGRAFRGNLGEFSLEAFQPSGMTSREDLFLEALGLACESKDVHKLIVVPDETGYGPRVCPYINKVDEKKDRVLFGMNPPACSGPFTFEMLGFPILRALGIRADEL